MSNVTTDQCCNLAGNEVTRILFVAFTSGSRHPLPIRSSMYSRYKNLHIIVLDCSTSALSALCGVHSVVIRLEHLGRAGSYKGRKSVLKQCLASRIIGLCYPTTSNHAVLCHAVHGIVLHTNNCSGLLALDCNIASLSGYLLSLNFSCMLQSPPFPRKTRPRHLTTNLDSAFQLKQSAAMLK